MARLAAGLLVADRRDMPGRELFNRARAALQQREGGGEVLPGEGGDAVDGWIGTLALALAARQIGEDALADALVRGAAPRLYLGAAGGMEAGFWLLAASVYGVFGVDGPDAVKVSIDGQPRTIALKRGTASSELPTGNVRVSLSSPRPVLARLEARYVRTPPQERGAALAVSVEGHPGYVGQTAALEAVVRSESDAEVTHPVLEVTLPAPALLSRSALAAISGAPGVRRVEPLDPRGLLRIHLEPLPAKQTRRVPLPLRWVAAGTVTGLWAGVHDARRPWLISSAPAQTLQLKPQPEERWQ